jgi:hypothetical protein
MSRNRSFPGFNITCFTFYINFWPIHWLSLVDKEDIFKSTSGNDSLHKTSHDNGARVVNFARSNNLQRVQCSHTATLINSLGHLLMERHTIRLNTFCQTGDRIQVHLMSGCSGDDL